MRGLSESTKELIEYARRLLEADYPQTLRQLHYAIFSRQEIDYANDKASYARLSRISGATVAPLFRAAQAAVLFVSFVFASVLLSALSWAHDDWSLRAHHRRGNS